MVPQLHVVVASTRPERAGLPVANWFYEFAASKNLFEVRMIDLAEINLPVLDEPNHPRLQRYVQQHTKDWSASVASADAFVFVTPEYNYSTPPALINALDYLYMEWNYKPVGFVSYGGMSGGLRSVQMTKLVVTALKMMPIPEGVAIPFFTQHIKDGSFVAGEPIQQAAQLLLVELHKWSLALRTLRTA